jgi:hypothetical protein
MIEVVPMPKPSAREVKLLHAAVKELTERLYKERFNIDLVWDKGDDYALGRCLQISVSTLNPWPKVAAEVESCIRGYFASDGISSGDRPYQWLPNLGKYRGGPLDRNGVPKSWLEAQRAEVDATIAASVREAEERKRADAAADREGLLARLVLMVAEDLRRRGFEACRPISDLSYIVATRKSASTQNCMAMRIVCRAYPNEVTKTCAFYQAVCLPDQDIRITPVTYHPPLEVE